MSVCAYCVLMREWRKEKHHEMKIDLVMWTLNSEKTLPTCLRSIELSIPQKIVHKKIMVDGHSQDHTREVGEKFGWKVYEAEKVGIPYQANQALSHVTTDIFASFEHDVVLNPDWFQYLFPYMAMSNIAVVQGIRLRTHPTLRKIDQYSANRCLKDKRHLRSHISIDNNLYKTDVVKSVGGFPIDCLISTDQLLRDKIEAHGFKWIIEPHVISDHLKHSQKEELSHIRWCAERSVKASPVKNTILFLYSPLSALKMAYVMKCPQIVTTYPLFRFARLKGSLTHESPIC